ncbi:hypothetical protein V6N13_001573 [Hibiscus sabdariffa]
MIRWRLRKPGEKRVEYGNGSEMFTCVVHYGGDFVLSPRMKYTSKSTAHFDFVDASRFSTFSLCDMVEKLDVVVPFVVYWRVPHTELCTSSPFEEEVHEEEKDHVAQEEENYEAREEDHVAEEEENYEAKEEEEDAEYHVVEEEENNVGAKEETNVAAEEENSADVEEETNAAEEEDVSVAEEEDEYAADEEDESVVDEEDESAADEFDISDNEYDCGRDEAYRQEDDIGIRVQRNMDGFGPDGMHVNDKDNGLESDSDHSENLYSEHGSDSDGPRYPEFNSETDMVKPKFVKGLVFPNKTTLKEAIKQYGRVDRVEVKLKKNDNRRLQALCKEGCPWKLWAAPMNPKDSEDHTWKIKTMVNCHTCSKSVSNSNITSKWMAKYYIGKFMSEPNYTLRSLRHDVLHEFGTLVSPGKCGRARDMALEMIEGNHKAQYGRIYDYLQELRSTNPRTTTICYLDLKLFQRMYVCQACKEGWKVGCRRIIGLDGCFLKGYFQGYLLSAVGVDANDCIYPITYAAVESENMSSWYWFVEILKTDLEIDNSFNICFMSDKHKGLKEVIEDVFPYTEARKCVRHMYTNFKEKYKGQALKDALWMAARATYLQEFKIAMEQLKALSEADYTWVKDKDPAQWSRSHFSNRSKCDMLLNNHCESFNKSISEARDKPILTMMETIRTKIMVRIVSKREAVEKCKGLLCGKIQKKLDINIEAFIRFWPTYAGAHKYQVEAGPSHQHVVDLVERSCSCRKWDLTRIPCPHAASVFRLNNLKPEDYVNECYHNSTQLAIYYVIAYGSGQLMLVHINIKLKLVHLINMLWTLLKDNVHVGNGTSLGSHVHMQHQSFD